MDACRLTEGHISRYRDNLTALAEDQPQLARRLKAVDIPASVERVTGRDGTDTFRIQRDDGFRQWLGRSSMPTISAPALVGGLQTSGRNLILPTIATGQEALVAQQQMPRHCAVFVYERDALALKLALYLHDFAGLIRQRRLVLLCGDHAGRTLSEFFAAHPGFEYPQHLLPLAGLEPGRQDQIRLKIKSAGPQVAEAQWAKVGRIGQQMQERTAFNLSEKPRAAVVSRDPRPEAIARAEQLGCAARQMGWKAAVSTPDRPDCCHPVARMDALKRHRPDLIVLVNCLKGVLAKYLPAGQPVCSWLITPDSVAAALGAEPEGNRIIFATRPEILERLRAAGASPDEVELLEVAVDTAVFAPGEQNARAQPEAVCPIAVLADAVDLGADAANITLTSHVRLWNELRTAVARTIGAWRDDSAPQLLKRAERASGTRLTERDLRTYFVEKIRCRLVPTLLTRRAIEDLVSAGLDVAVWGGGWEVHDSVKARLRGPIPDPAGRRAIYSAADVVLCPHFDQRTAQTVLDCLAAGGCPVYRRPEVPVEVLHPQLGEVLAAVANASAPEELVALAKRLAGDCEARREATANARSMVLERHTLAHRLRVIRERVLGL